MAVLSDTKINYLGAEPAEAGTIGAGQSGHTQSAFDFVQSLGDLLSGFLSQFMHDHEEGIANNDSDHLAHEMVDPAPSEAVVITSTDAVETADLTQDNFSELMAAEPRLAMAFSGFISDVERITPTTESIADAQNSEGPEIDGLRFYPSPDGQHIESQGGTESIQDYADANDWTDGIIHFVSRDLSDNVVYGWSGDDMIFTHQGNDKLYLGEGENMAFTGGGQDYILGGSGRDFIDGGSGNDQLVGGDGDDVLYGEGGTDRLFGNRGNDFLHGGGGDDYLNGLVGNDVLHGGGGNDKLYGASGNDRLHGGAGLNEFYGGSGRDVFVLGDKEDSDDHVMDFELGIDRFKFKSGLADEYQTLLGSDGGIDDVSDLFGNDGLGNMVMTLAGRQITITGITVEDMEQAAIDEGYEDWVDMAFIA